MKSLFLVLAAVPAIFVGALSASASAEELEVVNRPVNSSGLTGLITTTIPFTVPARSLEIGVSTLNETSDVPEYTLTEYPLTITYGIAQNMEVAVKGSYLYRKEGPNPVKERGAGDSEVLYKWNFYPQQEGSLYPAVAALASFIGLTGDNRDRFNRVHKWGVRLGLSAGREISWEDHVFGVYADARLALNDLDNDAYHERYGSGNIGILLPISKRRNLQILIEYGLVQGKRIADVDGRGSSTMTYGIRMVSERFNLTVGNQFIRKNLNGYNASGRVIATVSITF